MSWERRRKVGLEGSTDFGPQGRCYQGSPGSKDPSSPLQPEEVARPWRAWAGTRCPGLPKIPQPTEALGVGGHTQ